MTTEVEHGSVAMGDSTSFLEDYPLPWKWEGRKGGSPETLVAANGESLLFPDEYAGASWLDMKDGVADFILAAVNALSRPVQEPVPDATNELSLTKTGLKIAMTKIAAYEKRIAELEADSQEPVAWCQPNYEGKIHPRKFMVVYEDSEMGNAVFDSETEAREHFEKASVAWNCYLFGLMPRAAAPQPAHGTSATERDTPAPSDHSAADKPEYQACVEARHIGTQDREFTREAVRLSSDKYPMSDGEAVIDRLATELDRLRQTGVYSSGHGDGWRSGQKQLRDSVLAIAEDFIPDRDEDAPMALQEMRDALLAVIFASEAPTEQLWDRSALSTPTPKEESK